MLQCTFHRKMLLIAIILLPYNVYISSNIIELFLFYYQKIVFGNMGRSEFPIGFAISIHYLVYHYTFNFLFSTKCVLCVLDLLF